ncbi:hypothetical protein [uncultured Limosilactobacillus sp.]
MIVGLYLVIWGIICWNLVNDVNQLNRKLHERNQGS